MSDKPSKGTVFNVRKVKKDKEGKDRYYTVGTVFIRDNGEGGALFLDFLDGEFPLFKRAPKEAPAPATTEAEERHPW
jgi:hypothetical protein